MLSLDAYNIATNCPQSLYVCGSSIVPPGRIGDRDRDMIMRIRLPSCKIGKINRQLQEKFRIENYGSKEKRRDSSPCALINLRTYTITWFRDRPHACA